MSFEGRGGPGGVAVWCRLGESYKQKVQLLVLTTYM